MIKILKMINYWILAATILLFYQCQTKSVAQKTYNIKCEQLFYYIGQYWQKDSLGENGLRLLTADLIKDCYEDILKGKKWSEFEKYFGKPNIETTKNDLKIYRYKLTHWANPSYLDIGINDKDEIVRYKIWEIDG